MGAEIWVKVGDPAPTDPKELSFLSVDTRTLTVCGLTTGPGRTTSRCPSDPRNITFGRPPSPSAFK